MKTFFVVCLAIAAYADPEAQLLLNSPFYSGLAYQQPLAYQPLALQQPISYVSVPDTKIVKDAEVVEVEVAQKVEVPKTVVYAAPQQVLPYAALPVIQQQVVPKYVAKNGEVEHIVAKREADAQLLYSAGAYNPYVYGSAVAQPLVYSAAPVAYKTAATIVNPLAGVQAKTYANDFHPFTQTYAAKGQYVADSVGAVHIAKREATEPANFPAWMTLNAGTPTRAFTLNSQRLYKREADAQLLYSAGAYSPYAYSSAAYNPYVYSAAVAQPVAYQTAATLVNPLAGVQAKTYANDFHPLTQDYAAKGQYVADSVGAVHIAKREAHHDAQAPANFPAWGTLNAGTPDRTFNLNHQRLYKREAEPQYLSNYYSNPLWNVSPYTSAYSAYYPYSAYSGVRYF